MRSPVLLAVLFAVAACASQPDDSPRVSRYAQTHLPGAGKLRVTARSELSTDKTHVYLATRDASRDAGALSVATLPSGELIDDKTPNAFVRLAQAEHAAARIAELGSDKVALWFATFGGGACPPPDGDLHFATVSPTGEGDILISYPVAGGVETCVIDLAADSSLRGAHRQAIQPARAEAADWIK